MRQSWGRRGRGDMRTFRSALEVVVERADGAATGAHRQQDEAPVSGEYEPNTSLLRVVLSAYNNNNNSQHPISSSLQYNHAPTCTGISQTLSISSMFLGK